MPVRLTPDPAIPSGAIPPNATTAVASSRQSVLLIDDDAAVRELFSQALRLAGFEVVEASTGGAALDLLRSNPKIGVILLDLKMPDMDGWDFRLAQRRDARLASIPTIITTGAPLAEVLDCDLKAADYLLKPVGLEHLVSVVAHYVRPVRQTDRGW
jgi:CheY-like chemotaxis protein